ncbi:MAG: hypothetical protein RR902_03565, partial [Oscillospiraceae bacterium]
MKRKLRGVFLVICMMAMLTLPSFAYIDPSVATFSIQIIAGAVITIGAAVGIFWRRAKKKVSKKLGIDENAHKE